MSHFDRWKRRKSTAPAGTPPTADEVALIAMGYLIALNDAGAVPQAYADNVRHHMATDHAGGRHIFSARLAVSYLTEINRTRLAPPAHAATVRRLCAQFREAEDRARVNREYQERIAAAKRETAARTPA
jgi:hypothetical protein